MIVDIKLVDISTKFGVYKWEADFYAHESPNNNQYGKKQIGHAHGTILKDKCIVKGIFVFNKCQKMGVGTAALNHIMMHFQLPVYPWSPIKSAEGFWRKWFERHSIPYVSPEQIIQEDWEEQGRRESIRKQSGKKL